MRGGIIVEETKKVYEPSEIGKILGISKNHLYKFLEEVYNKQKPFTIIKIGRLYKIPKESFDRWVDGELIV